MERKIIVPDIKNPGNMYRNLPTPALYEEIVRRREGLLSHLGPVVVRTGQHTGRSPNDKFIVNDAKSKNNIWWGKDNKPMDTAQYRQLKTKLMAYFQGRDIFVQDCYAGADSKYRLSIRIITENAWHNLFARNMFIRELNKKVLATFKPDFTVYHAPQFIAEPEVDGTTTEAFIVANFTRKEVIIGGTAYAGEIKKSIFTVMNYILPHKKILGMHCSANVGKKKDVALFFGLSGTGKTTLSSSADRILIGDDEHGWGNDGIFNFEGGCYAKVIKLSEKEEPEIFGTTRKFGTILENVTIDHQSRRINLNDACLTQNTRAAYPIGHIPNSSKTGIGDHPNNIIMLTCDAFGVMPPIAKLSPEQAMYHFLSGYTAKVAGTERGITEPKATFSACFSAPFMALNPTVYADLLGQKIKKHKSKCWLINTGWTGGPYGVGKRMQIAYTRKMVRAALDGTLDAIPTTAHPVFKLEVPNECPGVPSEILWPRNTWENKRSYDVKANKLAKLFAKNFVAYKSYASDKIKSAAPKVK